MKQYVTQEVTVSQEQFLMTLDEVADNLSASWSQPKTRNTHPCMSVIS